MLDRYIVPSPQEASPGSIDVSVVFTVVTYYAAVSNIAGHVQAILDRKKRKHRLNDTPAMVATLCFWYLWNDDYFPKKSGLKFPNKIPNTCSKGHEITTQPTSTKPTPDKNTSNFFGGAWSSLISCINRNPAMKNPTKIHVIFILFGYIQRSKKTTFPAAGRSHPNPWGGQVTDQDSSVPMHQPSIRATHAVAGRVSWGRIVT